MTGIPLHRIVEGANVMVGDLVLVDDEQGWRKVHDVILSPKHAVLKYEGGSDAIGVEDFVSILRYQAVTSPEVC